MHLPSVSVETPLATLTGDFSSIRKKPVSYGVAAISVVATVIYASSAVQGITVFTNILQGHDTVVLVCCTIK